MKLYERKFRKNFRLRVAFIDSKYHVSPDVRYNCIFHLSRRLGPRRISEGVIEGEEKKGFPRDWKFPQ